MKRFIEFFKNVWAVSNRPMNEELIEQQRNLPYVQEATMLFRY